MDRLDQVLPMAASTLRRVDDLLAGAGAPAAHDLWPQVRRVRLLPGDAVRMVAALAPAEFADMGSELRIAAQSSVGVADDLPPPADWEGDAAEAYNDQRRRAMAHLSADDESLAARLTETADLAGQIAAWMTKTRHAVAASLVAILTSSDFETLAAAPAKPPSASEVTAAADIAAPLLKTIADSYDEAFDLLHASSDLKVAIPM